VITSARSSAHQGVPRLSHTSAMAASKLVRLASALLAVATIASSQDMPSATAAPAAAAVPAAASPEAVSEPRQEDAPMPTASLATATTAAAEAQQAVPPEAPGSATGGEEAAPSEVAEATPQMQVPAAADADAAHPQTANATEQARLDLEAVVAAAAMTSNGGGGAANLRGTAGWGHGIFGETCCMCSQHFGFTTVLYAAEDYSHFFGGHAANWWCQQECEVKCHYRSGGHMFGCYDEQHLLELDRLYGHRTGYQILHDRHFGNIC